MPKTNSLEDPALDALADRVMDAFAVFNAQLDTRRQCFPVAEFDGLWEAVLAYSIAMQNLKWLHRNVARELSGLREYLELEIFKTPSDAFWKADQMECFLFSGCDAYPEHGKPPGLEKRPDEMAVAFAGYEGECAGCEQFLIVNELGVCVKIVHRNWKGTWFGIETGPIAQSHMGQMLSNEKICESRLSIPMAKPWS